MTEPTKQVEPESDEIEATDDKKEEDKPEDAGEDVEDEGDVSK